MDKLTLIVKAVVNTEQLDSFNTYITNLMAFYEKAKAVQIAYYQIKETFIGKEIPSFIVIVEFPGRTAFDFVYESTEYKQTMVPLREKGFKQLEVYIC